MGKKTHGPVLVAAIEHNDYDKVREVLLTHIKTKARIQALCISEVRRLASEYTEVPILLAASLPDPAIVKFLVGDQDVNLNFVHKETYKRKTKIKTALITAVRMSLIATVEAILALNAQPNTQDHKGRTALHHAVRKADYRTAKMLLTRGAKPNITDIAGNTPLHIATIFGHVELVKLLIHHDADMFKKGTGGAIPMHMAAKEGHSALVVLFCQYGVNVNMKVPCYDNREKAPIHVSAEEGHAETVLVLLDKCGAEPNLRDSLGETPLHCTCLREYDPMGMKSKDDYTETTKVILQYGAHIDLQNSRGETPLHLAARNEFQKTVEVLIQAGSDPTLEDSAGYKPYDLATADDTVTVQLLKGAMEERDQIMSDAMELQAKGYSTAVVKQAGMSRSGLNMTSMASADFSTANSIYEDGYLQPVGLRPRQNTFVGSQGSSHDIFGKSQSTSSSGSKRSLNKQKRAGSKSSLHNLDQSNGDSRDVPRNRNAGRTLPNPPNQAKHDSKNTEISSFWDITPRTSVSTVKAVESPVNKKMQEINKSYESLPLNDGPVAHGGGGAKKPRGRRAPKPTKGQNTIQIMAAFPNSNKIPGVQPKVDTTDDDSFFDDESFDTLDSPSERNAPAVPPKASKAETGKVPLTPEEQRKIFNAVSNQSLHSWLDEQADILKKDGPMPPPPSTASHAHEVYSTASDISSVSKVRRGIQQAPQLKTFDKPGKPPPLPPKPAPRKPQNVDPAPIGQTVIKVMAAELQKPTSVSEMSESTMYTEDTVVYKQHERMDSKITTTEDSVSATTESTVQKSPGKKKNQKKAKTSKRRQVEEEESSTIITTEDDTNQEFENGGPMSLHARNIARSIQARNNTAKPVAVPQPPANRRGKVRSADMDDDTSNSLSWGSSEGEPVVEVQARHGVKFDNAPSIQNVKQGIPIDSVMNTSLRDDYRFYKSVGDLQSASSAQIQSHMQRKYSEGDLLSTTNSSYPNQNNRNRQPQNRNKSLDLSEMRGPAVIEEDITDEAFGESEVSSAAPSWKNQGRVKTERADGGKTITCEATVCHQMKLAGGNDTGVFIQSIPKVPSAQKLGLEVGDEILEVNKQAVKNLTKEEVNNLLQDVKISASLCVKKTPIAYGKVNNNGGAGDLFFIRMHFKYDAGARSDVSFGEGDVFAVHDTLPLGKPGMWFAVRANGKPTDPPRQGLIPNHDKAQQIATSIKIALLRAEEIKQKKGGIRKGFARAKSLDRSLNKNETEEFRNAIKDVVSYERVVSKPCPYKRPVVLLGLFCDSVRELLITDLPQYFDKPAGAIELPPSDNPNQPPIDTAPIEAVMSRDKHCIVILSPGSVKYLQERTDMNALVIYLCPQNKAMVKSLKQRFAPGFDRKPGFMYDEAIHFSKQHGHMFTEVVKYTADGGWLSTLKDSIAKLQNVPTWHPDVVDDEEDSDLDDSDEWDDDQNSQVQQLQPAPHSVQPGSLVEQPRRGRKPRVSKTTDDIPTEIQNVLSQHVMTGAMLPPSKSQSMGDALNQGYVQDVDTYDNSPRSRPRQRTNRQTTDSYDNNNSSGSSEKKLTSILKNKSHSSLSDDLSGELDSTSSSGHRAGPQQQYGGQQAYNTQQQYGGQQAYNTQQQHTQRMPQQRPQQQQQYIPQQQMTRQQHSQQQYVPQNRQHVQGYTTML